MEPSPQQLRVYALAFTLFAALVGVALYHGMGSRDGGGDDSAGAVTTTDLPSND